ncbi:RNA polymerase sigma factor [Filimonas effusa]|uniref:RNA polymerase sigma-70 factor n=1 Tax=Filimonas effusa TaxID=2508721 RepID=A0A4Q1D2J9_9BACT|nr:RNA polymerase sigma-70 factor [Filimonas effusa]RXK81447.1 RNA polymerase sigma-70 factor [Filimonas effusa]
MLTFPDTELLDRVAAGDEAAFSLLFARFRDQLFAYLNKVTKSREVAEEVVLDVFVKIWRGRAALTSVNNFEAFLITVARNCAIDFLRRAQRDKVLQEQLRHAMPPVTADAADGGIIREHTRTAILAAVAELSPQRKMVFLLSREQGLSYEEIAARMDISAKTVANHLSSALQFIRDRLRIDDGAVSLLLLCCLR